MKLIDHNKTALIWNDEEISYRTLLQKIIFFESLYSILPGERVAVFAENSPEWIYAFFSAWGHRGIPVPIDAGLPAEDIVYILDDSRPSIVFCSEKLFPIIGKAISGIHSYSPEIHVLGNLPADQPAVHESEEADNDDTAVIIYTSGTTGNPKGVMLTYSNLLTSINGLIDLNMITPQDRFMGILPFHHIFPLQGSVIAPLYIGGTTILLRSLSPDEILLSMRKHRPTIFLGVPRLYEMFLRSLMKKINMSIPAGILFRISRAIGSLTLSRILFSQIQKAFGGAVIAYLSGGAGLDRIVEQDLRALGFKLVEGYGLTEASPLVAFNPFNAVRQGSVGLVMKGVEVRIVDGEVSVRGKNIMKGYYNKPEETAKTIRDGWFFTGDRGWLDRKGYLYLSGRCDDMIVLSNGKKINPEEIEKKICALTSVISKIAVLENEGRLTAVIFPDAEEAMHLHISNAEEHIRSIISREYNASAAEYKKILQIHIAEHALPETRMGKVKRYLLNDFTEIHRLKLHTPF